jgi:hypothetical protein
MIDLKLRPFIVAQDVLTNWSAMLHAGNGNRFPDGVPTSQRKLAVEHLTPLLDELSQDEFALCRLGLERLLVTLCTPGSNPGRIVSEVDDARRRILDQSEAMSCLWLSPAERTRYQPKSPLFGAAFQSGFTGGGAFELDEAAKCLALGRSTACVFHLMRLMEISVRAVARCLGIPDPLPGDRSWGKVLENVRNGIKAKWPTVAARETGDGKLFDDLHAFLDAVKNPWRNSTMHPANKYTPEEAEHIFVAVRGFVTKLADRCDENGLPLA